MTQTRTQLEATLFDAVAELGKLLGLNKSTSLALALLYTADVPLSLDDIAARTGTAKSSNSVILKNLEQMGLAQVVDRPHDRRKFYKIVDNPGDAVAILVAQRLDNLTTRAENLPDDDQTEHSAQFVCRLNQLKSIYNVLLQAATYLRAQRAEAWDGMSSRLSPDLYDQ
jgi:DNA-binding transcriptional regulator GbsR (MarR family)